ncbi:MAG: LamB/YcsF family protein, partial [Acidobacteriota bacterium]|nr:LamB/YcsF family protein [Acidobacteriota bacterium]
AEGVTLRHVKPHGALYNMAARDPALADAIARAVAQFDPSLVLFGLAGSPMLDGGRAAGLAVAAEGFADRAYEPDGSLTPRARPGAVIHDLSLVVARAVRMATESRVTARDGSEIRLHVDTICVHGDTPGAADLAHALRQGLEVAGVQVRPAGGPGE